MVTGQTEIEQTVKTLPSPNERTDGKFQLSIGQLFLSVFNAFFIFLFLVHVYFSFTLSLFHVAYVNNFISENFTENCLLRQVKEEKKYIQNKENISIVYEGVACNLTEQQISGNLSDQTALSDKSVLDPIEINATSSEQNKSEKTSNNAVSLF